MNINSINNLNFQKKLVAKTTPIKHTKKNCYKIYQLEKSDRSYFTDTLYQWGDSMFCMDMIDDFESGDKYHKIYALEDDKNNCLAWAEIYTGDDDGFELEYIETRKDISHANRERKTKHVGETLLAFLVGLSKRNLKDDFVVPHTLTDAEGFYIKNCGFKRYERGRILATHKPKEEFDDFISKNEKHIGCKIEYLI